MGVLVHLEEARLDVDDLLGPRPVALAALIGEDGVEEVVVAEVVGGDRPEREDELEGHADVVGDLLAVRIEELRQAIDAVDPDGPLPGQVVESDVLQLDLLRRNAEARGEPSLEPDRHVAQPDRAMSVVEEGLAHDPDGIGEIDDPVAGRRSLGRALRDVEDHRHRAERLGETAGAGRLLTDRPEPQRQRLVDEAGRLSTDAQLDDDEIRPVEGGVSVWSQDEPAGPLHPVEHPASEPADDLDAVRIGVEQDELVDREAVAANGDALDQLRRVGASAADDRDLDAHPASVPVGPSVSRPRRRLPS